MAVVLRQLGSPRAQVLQWHLQWKLTVPCTVDPSNKSMLTSSCHATGDKGAGKDRNSMGTLVNSGTLCKILRRRLPKPVPQHFMHELSSQLTLPQCRLRMAVVTSHSFLQHHSMSACRQPACFSMSYECSDQPSTSEADACSRCAAVRRNERGMEEASGRGSRAHAFGVGGDGVPVGKSGPPTGRHSSASLFMQVRSVRGRSACT